MLRVNESESAAQAKKYHGESMIREGYYADGQEMPGLWGGKGARLLGLSGEGGREAFMRLCDNLHPITGEKLTARMRQDRRPGYDFNFHPPKSVTLAYFWHKDKREAILKAFHDAVDRTMEDIERDAMTRVRSNGRDEDRHTGNLVWKGFTHFTARPKDGLPDPHIHRHVYVFNATFDPVEKKWKATQLGDIIRDINSYQAAFHSRMAEGLRKLGFEIEKRPFAFEIAGVPRELIKQFSRRGEFVEATALARGITDPAIKDKLAALTREKKIKDVPLSSLEPIWRAWVSPEHAKALDGLVKGQQLVPAMAGKSSRMLGEKDRPLAVADAKGMTEHDRRALAYAIEHVFERKSVVNEREIVATAVSWGIECATLAGVKEALKEEGKLIWVEREGQKLATTWAIRAEEGRIVNRCQQGKGKMPALNPAWRIKGDKLNEQQKDAVCHVITSRDFIIGISGKAGTGKTTLLHEAKQAIEAGGNKLLVLAPTAEAARGVLRKQGFENAETIAKLLSSESLQREYHGAVWWVDEAGLMSTRLADKFLRLAEECGARVVLVGDTGQHHAVERGQAFDLLQKHGGMLVTEVEEIQRQRGEYKRAVEQIADLNFEGAFETLCGMGAMLEMPLDQREKRLAADFLETMALGKTAMVVSPTHAECNGVSEAIRNELKKSGQLGRGQKRSVLRDLHWTEAQKRYAPLYEPGMVVQVNNHVRGFSLGEQMEVLGVSHGEVVLKGSNGVKSLPMGKAEAFGVYEKEEIEVCEGESIRISGNGRTADGHRLNNGSMHKVSRVMPDGRIFLENGWELKKEFKHIAHGYSATSHAAQGMTVDVVLVSQSGLYSSAASDANQFYVSVSRGRENVRIYTDNIDALQNMVARVRERPMATEVLEGRAEGGVVALCPPWERSAELLGTQKGNVVVEMKAIERANGKAADRNASESLGKTDGTEVVKEAERMLRRMIRERHAKAAERKEERGMVMGM